MDDTNISREEIDGIAAKCHEIIGFSDLDQPIIAKFYVFPILGLCRLALRALDADAAAADMRERAAWCAEAHDEYHVADRIRALPLNGGGK